MIVVASDVTSVRRRWRERLGDLSVREVRDWPSLTALVTRQTPSVVLLDIGLPGLRGVARLSRLVRPRPSMRVVLLSPRPSDDEALAGLAAGARGYADRELDPTLVRKAVEMVQKGEIWAGRRLIARLVEELAAARPAAGASAGRRGPLADLTSRQRDVASLVAAGSANKEIAAALGVTERTVKAHLTLIFRKLGVADRLRLALFINGSVPRPGVDTPADRHDWTRLSGPGPTSSLRIDVAGP